MLTRRFVLSMVAVCGLVLSSAGSAEAFFGGGCGGGCGCGGGFLRGLFGHHGCCADDCGCDSCDSGCEGDAHGDGGCGCGEAMESAAPSDAPAAPEAAPAAPATPAAPAAPAQQ